MATYDCLKLIGKKPPELWRERRYGYASNEIELQDMVRLLKIFECYWNRISVTYGEDYLLKLTEE